MGLIVGTEPHKEYAMSSEAITRNDLKAVLNEVLPSEPIIHDLKALQVSGSFNNSAMANVTANVPTGYTFLCWVQGSSQGWTGVVYPASPLQQNSNFWTTSARTGDFVASYLVYK